jgi:integrase
MSRTRKKVPQPIWRNGWAYASWYDPRTRTTKRISLGTQDPHEAAARFAHYLVEGKAITEPEALNQLTVSQALDHYLLEHVATACADPGRQEIAVRNLKAFFGDTLLAEIDIPKSRRYAAARRAGEIGGNRHGHKKVGSDPTIRRELNVLIAAANHAVRWKRLNAQDVPRIELPTDSGIGKDDEAPFFSRHELSAMLAVARVRDEELALFIELAYYTGARRASITDLTRNQVDWEHKRILLQRPGKKATKKRQPIVPILPGGMTVCLERLWELSGEREKLFSDLDFYRRFKTLCRGQGLGQRDHPHLLRHSRATHLLQDGVSIYAVARLLGDTVQTVERVYGHHSHEAMAAQLATNGDANEASLSL